MSTNTLAGRAAGKPAAPDLKVKTVIRLFLFSVIMGVILFALAGRLDWAAGWAYLAVLTLWTGLSAVAVPIDEELVEERTQLKPHVPAWDRWLVVPLSFLYPLGFVVIGGLDERLNWSAELPLWLHLAGLALLIAGGSTGAWAARVNRFYARFVRIQEERGHHVISVGPYAIVRHPGYAGLILSLLGTPLALGSLWAFTLGGLMFVALLVRTVLEDGKLQTELPGYAEYTRQTRYRLLPGIW